MESKFLISVNYSFIVIKIAAVSSVNIDLCECLSLLDSDCGMCACVCVCVCVYVCVISNQSTSRKPHYVSDLSKLDVLLHKTHQASSGTRLDICRS